MQTKLIQQYKLNANWDININLDILILCVLHIDINQNNKYKTFVTTIDRRDDAELRKKHAPDLWSSTLYK